MAGNLTTKTTRQRASERPKGTGAARSQRWAGFAALNDQDGTATVEALLQQAQFFLIAPPQHACARRPY